MSKRRQCPAKSKRTGERCKRFLAPGQKVCRWHGGGAPQVSAAADRRAEVELFTGELVRLGVAVDVDPGEALLAMVHEAAGNVAYLRSRVQSLHVDELYGRVDESLGKLKAEPHVLVVMYAAERDRLATCAALAIRAGVEERRVRLAEATTERLFAAVTTALNAAGLNPAQSERFRVCLAAELRQAA